MGAKRLIQINLSVRPKWQLVFRAPISKHIIYNTLLFIFLFKKLLTVFSYIFLLQLCHVDTKINYLLMSERNPTLTLSSLGTSASRRTPSWARPTGRSSAESTSPSRHGTPPHQRKRGLPEIALKTLLSFLNFPSTLQAFNSRVHYQLHQKSPEARSG